MPRYVVERFFDRVSDDDMLAASVRSDRMIVERFPEITWEHSHVVVDDDGAIKTFCVYGAPTEQMIRDHADAFGAHTITNIYELVGDVTPEEIRSRAAAAKT
jgi:ligand-binding SRPBCC domain-containing protein